MRSFYATLMLVSAAMATSASAASISPTSQNPQLIGAITAGTSYTLTTTGVVDLCGSCNGGGPLVFGPDGKVTTTALGLYTPFNAGPLDYDPSVSTTAYGVYGKGINVGELYGSFVLNPTASDLFAIGFGTTFKALTTGFVYGVINDTAYGDNPPTPQFTVTLSQVGTVPVTGAAPEPATWAMMILGFGMVGFGLRRRRKVTTEVSYAG